MSTASSKPVSNFTSSFKKTVARYETLSDGKKADYERTLKKTRAHAEARAKKQPAD